ncbi:MAG: hypothetical protein J6I73_01665 [Treponema sp.]|nr:hypothetical protein [Treponema sp.]
MKSITKDFSIYMKPIVLDFSDVAEICKILSVISDEYEIKTDDTEFENFEELKNYSKDVISNLKISTKIPYITIDFYKHSPAKLYIAEDTLVSRGALEKIRDVLNAKIVKSYSVISIFDKVLKRVFYADVLLSIVLFAFNLLKPLTIFEFFLPFACFYILFGVFSTTYTTLIENRYSLIYLKGKEPSFWIRKKDEIILLIISNIISFILGLIIS